MKYALVTRSDDNIKEMSDLTHPILKEYAARCKADFIIFDHETPVRIHDDRPHYRILKAQQLLDTTYDRILFLDTDMVITKNCPNIFETVPYNKIGSIYEDKGSRQHARRRKMSGIQSAWQDVGWRKNYTNAGTFIVSKCHKGMFDSYKGKYWTKWGSVDLHLSFMAHLRNYNFHELDYRWNHMSMFSQEWNGSPDRFNSFIIHYAGKGIFDAGVKNRLAQIKHDINKIYGS